jgi:hypothetical protein
MFSTLRISTKYNYINDGESSGMVRQLINLVLGTRGRGFESRHSDHSDQLTPKTVLWRAFHQLATGLFPRAEAILASNSSSRSIVTGFTKW